MVLKVEELEKEILDANQKIEFFRAKMQELVSIYSWFGPLRNYILLFVNDCMTVEKRFIFCIAK